MDRWIKMRLGTKVGIDPSDVLNEDLAPPLQKGAQALIFLAHICCGQTAGWIKMPLGTMVGLGPGNRYGPSSTPQGAQPPKFRPMSVVVKGLDESRYHLIER